MALGVMWVGGVSLLVSFVACASGGRSCRFFLVYSLLALRDLLRHGWNVETGRRRRRSSGRARGNRETRRPRHIEDGSRRLPTSRHRKSQRESHRWIHQPDFLVRDPWPVPGLVLFKVVSTMDSMVGYKTPRYLRFGWCGARTDDLMNWIPARLTWLLIAGLSALCCPAIRAGKASSLDGASMRSCPARIRDGAKRPSLARSSRKLIGPIWAHGKLVTEVWLGDPADPAAGKERIFAGPHY